MKRHISKLWHDRSSRIGLIIVAIVCICAVFAPILAPQDPFAQNLSKILKPPSLHNLLGTDFYGRDLLSRLIYGTRISLTVSIIATSIAVFIGIVTGLFAGFIGKWLDQIIMRTVDVLLGFPKLFILLLAVGFGRPSIWLTVFVLSLFSWMEIARIVRGEVIIVKEMLYVKSAIALGLSKKRILMRHIFPNVIGPIIVSTTLLIGTVILIETSLSFLGLGVQPPNASWGTILNQGRIDLIGGWWISAFTGIVIVITVVGFNLLGDGLRNIFDPKNSD